MFPASKQVIVASVRAIGDEKKKLKECAVKNRPFLLDNLNVTKDGKLFRANNSHGIMSNFNSVLNETTSYKTETFWRHISIWREQYG